jgi:hypothetical protein
MKVERVVFQVPADRPPILVGVVLIAGEIVELHHIGYEVAGKLNSVAFDMTLEMPKGIVHFYPAVARREELAKIVLDSTHGQLTVLETCPKHVVTL